MTDTADLPAEAARQPIKFTGKLEAGYVKVRITFKGHLKIHTGQVAKSSSPDKEVYDGTNDLFPKYWQGDEVALPVKIAKAQQDNGYCEIEA